MGNIYKVYAEENNVGMHCVKETEDLREARELVQEINSCKYAGCYLNAKLEIERK